MKRLLSLVLVLLTLICALAGCGLRESDSSRKMNKAYNEFGEAFIDAAYWCERAGVYKKDEKVMALFDAWKPILLEAKTKTADADYLSKAELNASLELMAKTTEEIKTLIAQYEIPDETESASVTEQN